MGRAGQRDSRLSQCCWLASRILGHGRPGRGQVMNEREVLIRSFVGWEYGAAVDRLERAVNGSNGPGAAAYADGPTPWVAIDEARTEFLAVDAELTKLREDPSYELDDDRKREFA